MGESEDREHPRQKFLRYLDLSVTTVFIINVLVKILDNPDHFTPKEFFFSLVTVMFIEMITFTYLFDAFFRSFVQVMEDAAQEVVSHIAPHLVLRPRDVALKVFEDDLLLFPLNKLEEKIIHVKLLKAKLVRYFFETLTAMVLIFVVANITGIFYFMTNPAIAATTIMFTVFTNSAAVCRLCFIGQNFTDKVK
ncbi:hypothetical protein Hamer_G026381, partial [Homarus americanus]